MGIFMSELILKCGAAREDITPPVGTLLYGYNPHQVSTSIHDRLNLTAVLFGQRDEYALLVTMTVGDIQNELCGELRTIAGSELGLPPSRVIICATHTHSAPNVAGFEGWGEIDREYVDGILISALKRAVRRAFDSLEPAELAVGETESKIGVNRRQLARDGSILFGQNQWGAYDPTLTCIAVRAVETGRGIVNLIHYGCHGTAAGCNQEISRDWSGVMCDRLEAVTHTLTAFWNGAIGDVGPRLTNGGTTGDIHYVEELGGFAAADALRAYNACGRYAAAGLEVCEGEAILPYKPLPPLDEVEARLRAYDDPEKLYNIDGLRYNHYRSIKAEYDAGLPNAGGRFGYQQTLIRLGDIMFVPHPFEVFSEICLRLREYLPARYVLNLSNANGYNGYLPTEDQLVRGGYEVEVFAHAGVYTLVDNADQVLIDENLRIAQDFGKQ